MDKNGSKWSEEDDNYLFDNILLQNKFLSDKLNLLNLFCYTINLIFFRSS